MSQFGNFTCDHCKQTFLKLRPDSEADAEYEERWGIKREEDDREHCILCDDCHIMIIDAVGGEQIAEDERNIRKQINQERN